MTALRQNVIDLVGQMPEDKLSQIFMYIVNIVKEDTDISRSTTEDASYYSLLRMIKPIPNLDEEKELNEYRMERYEL
ncbi:MAG: hypothetical protein IKN43_11690 [Selenomonadaceae bacterium]|nr:hypothetical protein [Selenomonadaceae bacterium]